MGSLETLGTTPTRRPQRPGRALVRRALVSGAAAACSLALVAPSSATPVPVRDPEPGAAKRKVDSQITDLRSQLDETGADLARAYRALRATRAKLPAARTALGSANAVARAAAAANAVAQQELAVARAAEKKAEAQLRKTSGAITTGRTKVAQLAAEMYTGGGTSELQFVSDGDPQQVADRMSMAGTVMELKGASLTRLSTARANQTALEAQLSAKRAASARAAAKARRMLAAANAARDRAARAKQRLDALAATQTRQARGVTARLAGERRRLSGMKQESDRLGRILAARARAEKAREARRAKRSGGSSGGGTSSAPSGGGFLSPPMAGAPVTSEFGMRYHPILHYSRLHAGRDYGGGCGTPIRAAAGGTVILSGWAGGYGNQIVIAHGVHRGVSLTTTYNHMQRRVVHGGHVSRGQIIGYEGTTGLSTGCHLHFETREDGVPRDPRRWL